MLDGGVLVLNRVYQPVHVTSVRRALTLLYQGIARALDGELRQLDFDSWRALAAAEESVGTVRGRIRIPRIIVLLACERLPRARIRFSRLNVYARDGDTCQYCGRRLRRSDLNLDHVVPRSRGGGTSWDNVVCSCVPCNLRKGGRTPEEAGMTLLRHPARPRWTPLFRGGARGALRAEWRPFLTLADAAYWNAELLD
jgi:5-methylcytosine-specific restriction endonuclease McrA